MFGLLNNLFSKPTDPQLEQLVKEGAFLVDVRSAAEYAEGHPTGSTNIPLDQIQKQLHQFKGKSHSVVFCRSGARSSQAKATLEQNGIKNVTNGGTWQQVDAAVKNK